MEATQPGPTAVSVTTGGLTRRLLASVVAAFVAFAVVHRATLVAAGDGTLAIVIAAGAAIVFAAFTLRRAVAPLVATQADLQIRYEAALADALRDQLTGLGNHRAFHEELDRQVAGALRYEVPLSLLLVDLDDFKSVNDGRGHAGGDRVLRGMGDLLGAGLRRADRAFRIGGDEFAVILPHTDAEGARVVARRLLAQALQPARAGGLEPVSFSGGIASLPEQAVSLSQLYSQADAALYAAKRGGRTDIAIFDGSMPLAPDDLGASSSAVAEVIARGQLRPAYQPIVSLANGRVIGVEGLIRPVPPAPFADPGELFAAAEASGRLMALDLACIETIVAGAAELPEDQFLSLNLSPATAESADFSSGAIVAILARHNFSPERLVIEITERQQLYDPERLRGRIEACRRAGIRFAADDVGAGNNGLRLLADIRFDIVKVDLSLVQRSASDMQSSAVLSSIVELAARTGALVVAEGIEHGTQVAPLQDMGITVGQGFYLGRPEPLMAISATSLPPNTPAVGVAAWRQTMGMTSVS